VAQAKAASPKPSADAGPDHEPDNELDAVQVASKEVKDGFILLLDKEGVKKLYFRP
jgi:hypothetical protein